MNKHIFRPDPELDRLEHYLNYELSGGLLLAISFFYSAALYVLYPAALWVLVVMMRVLIRKRKFGWLAAFAIMVILPSLLIYITFTHTSFVQSVHPLFVFAFPFVPLVLFILYSFFLRIKLPDWREPSLL